MKILLFIIICSFSFIVSAEENISIALGETTYSTDGSFKAELTGQNIEPVRYIGLSIEMRQDEKWVVIRRDTSCPCLGKCKKKVTALSKGQKVKETWDFKNDACGVVTPGVYRAVVTGNYISELGGNLVLGSSREFRIK